MWDQQQILAVRPEASLVYPDALQVRREPTVQIVRTNSDRLEERNKMLTVMLTIRT